MTMRHFLIEKVVDADHNTERKLVVAQSPLKAWYVAMGLFTDKHMPPYEQRGGDYFITELQAHYQEENHENLPESN